MNYLSIYKFIVHRAKRQSKFRKLHKKYGGYYENHHIIPKYFLDKKKVKNIWDGKWNKVLLTAKEHFIAHLLLWKICIKTYGKNNDKTVKMSNACFMMSNKIGKCSKEKITSKIYENLKIQYSKNMSIQQTGINNSMHNKTPWNKGKKCPQLSGENNGMYGEHPEGYWKDKKRPDLSGNNSFLYNKIGNLHPNGDTWRLTFEDQTTEITTCINKCPRLKGYHGTSISDVYYKKKIKYKDVNKVKKWNYKNSQFEEYIAKP